MSIKNIFQSGKQKISSLMIQARTNTMSAQEVLTNNDGSILEYVLIAVIVVVLAGSLLEYNTGLFSKTIFPSLTSRASDLFGS
jgi:hypothetical protein